MDGKSRSFDFITYKKCIQFDIFTIMKNIVLVLLVAFTLGCSKNDEVVARQGVDFELTNTTTLDNGTSSVKSYGVAEVRIWNAKGKELSYDGTADRLNAFDSITGQAVAPDYLVNSVSKSIVELPAGEYFLAFITAANQTPSNAYSYTKFAVKAGEFFTVRKDIALMNANGYTIW